MPADGVALFVGLNGMPKRSTLTEYSWRCDPRRLDPFAQHGHHALRVLYAGRSFALDLHAIPYHGDDALVETSEVSKRSRRPRILNQTVRLKDCPKPIR